MTGLIFLASLTALCFVLSMLLSRLNKNPLGKQKLRKRPELRTRQEFKPPYRLRDY